MKSMATVPLSLSDWYVHAQHRVLFENSIARGSHCAHGVPVVE